MLWQQLTSCCGGWSDVSQSQSNLSLGDIRSSAKLDITLQPERAKDRGMKHCSKGLQRALRAEGTTDCFRASDDLLTLLSRTWQSPGRYAVGRCRLQTPTRLIGLQFRVCQSVGVHSAHSQSTVLAGAGVRPQCEGQGQGFFPL